jgi:hypothetical protein
MNPIRSFVAASGPPSDLRDEMLMGVVAGELAACLRRFIDVTADDGTLVRAQQALALWDLLAGAAGEGPTDTAPCRGREAVPLSGSDRAVGVAAIVA